MRAAWLIALFFPLMLAAQDLAAERKLYAEAHKDAQASDELLRITAGKAGSVPVQEAYRGAALMVGAQFAKGVGSKLKLFKEGKELMTKAIAAEPESVEIHFLRMTVQENAPAILGYNDFIAQDKAYVLQQFPSLRDTGLKGLIQDHARSSVVYSAEERTKLLPDR